MTVDVSLRGNTVAMGREEVRLRVRLLEAAVARIVLADEHGRRPVPGELHKLADVERGARNLGLVNSLRIARALAVPLSQLVADAEERLGRG